MIYFKNVNKWSGTHHVLKNIDEHIKPAEVVVICGPSGAGKSTMIRCINQLESIDEGEIIIEGINISHKKIERTDLRGEVGMVFQNFNLYPHMKVIKNITCAKESQRS